MTYRDLTKRLKKNKCVKIRTDGRHEVWGCPCGRHTAPVPNHGQGSEVSAGVIRSITNQLECLTQGAIQ